MEERENLGRLMQMLQHMAHDDRIGHLSSADQVLRFEEPSVQIRLSIGYPRIPPTSRIEQVPSFHPVPTIGKVPAERTVPRTQLEDPGSRRKPPEQVCHVPRQSYPSEPPEDPVGFSVHQIAEEIRVVGSNPLGPRRISQEHARAARATVDPEVFPAPRVPNHANEGGLGRAANRAGNQLDTH